MEHYTHKQQAGLVLGLKTLAMNTDKDLPYSFVLMFALCGANPQGGNCQANSELLGDATAGCCQGDPEAWRRRNYSAGG